jgi:hypothetical protein
MYVHLGFLLKAVSLMDVSCTLLPLVNTGNSSLFTG